MERAGDVSDIVFGGAEHHLARRGQSRPNRATKRVIRAVAEACPQHVGGLGPVSMKHSAVSQLVARFTTGPGRRRGHDAEQARVNEPGNDAPSIVDPSKQAICCLTSLHARIDAKAYRPAGL